VRGVRHGNSSLRPATRNLRQCPDGRILLFG
jgi:hypothetical protein